MTALCSRVVSVWTRLQKFSPLHDNIVLAQAMFANFGAVQSDMTQVGANTVITYDPADVITLTGVKDFQLAGQRFSLRVIA